MPIATTVDPEAKLVRHLVSGRVTLAEIMHVIERVYGDPQFDTSMDFCVEVAPGATEGLTSVDLSGVVHALRNLGERRGTGRTALAASAEADHGIVRVLAHVLQDGTREMRVFRDAGEALTWLGH